MTNHRNLRPLPGSNSLPITAYIASETVNRANPDPSAIQPCGNRATPRFCPQVIDPYLFFFHQTTVRRIRTCRYSLWPPQSLPYHSNLIPTIVVVVDKLVKHRNIVVNTIDLYCPFLPISAIQSGAAHRVGGTVNKATHSIPSGLDFGTPWLLLLFDSLRKRPAAFMIPAACRTCTTPGWASGQAGAH